MVLNNFFLWHPLLWVTHDMCNSHLKFEKMSIKSQKSKILKCTIKCSYAEACPELEDFLWPSDKALGLTMYVMEIKAKSAEVSLDEVADAEDSVISPTQDKSLKKYRRMKVVHVKLEKRNFSVLIKAFEDKFWHPKSEFSFSPVGRLTAIHYAWRSL